MILPPALTIIRFIWNCRCIVHEFNWITETCARLIIFEYLEVFHNDQRRHSALDYLSLVVFERVRLPVISVSTKWGEVHAEGRWHLWTGNYQYI